MTETGIDFNFDICYNCEIIIIQGRIYNMAVKPKVNYLNNKDMLVEIHKSKSSYCEFVEPHYHQHDIILYSIDDIWTPESVSVTLDEEGNENSVVIPSTIDQAKQRRADRLSSAEYNAVLAKFTKGEVDKKPKSSDFIIDPASISTDDLVFRVLTYTHIPKAPDRKKSPKKESDHYPKLNFNPFIHVIINESTKEVTTVGKSHYKNGVFKTSSFV